VFVGVFEHRIDGNGRVSLPASFRSELDGECYLRHHPDGHLIVIPSSRYREEAEALLARIRAGEATDAELARLGESSLRVAIDKQGRITLDDKAMAHAGIRPGASVTFAGHVFWFSVWRPSRHATVHAEREQAAPGRVWADEDDGAADDG
jgi:DNA-binding transcriptional regulator/RsmH inhibitor MraZ